MSDSQKIFNIKINGIKEGINDTSSLGDKLNSLNEGMKSGVGEANNYAHSIKAINKEIKAIQGEMAGLEKGSKAWVELAKKSGELKDKIDDIRQATNRFASDTKGLDDVINLAKSATSAFGILQASMEELGMSTEGTAEAIKKLQATMTLMQSLQQLQNSLKGSSATAELLTGAMKKLGIGMEGVSTSSKVLKTALAGIGIGLVIIAVTTLVEHWEDLVGWFEKTFPMLGNLGDKFSKMLTVIKAVGSGVVNFLINPFKTFAEVVGEILKGNFDNAVKAAIEGAKRQFTAFSDAFNESMRESANERHKQLSKQAAEETQYQLKMLEAQYGNEAKYSQKYVELKKQELAQRKKAAEGNSKELREIALEEVSFFREQEEHKTKLAKDGGKNRTAAAKDAARERQKAEEELKRQQEKAAKEEEERNKRLYKEQSKYTQLLLEQESLRYQDDLRNIHNDMDTQDELISKYKDEQKQLEKIISSNNTSNKVRKQAQDEWNKLNNKIISSQKEKNKLIDQEAEIQKQLIRLEQDRKTQSVFDALKEEIRETLKLKELSNEEFMNYINQDSEQFNKLSDDMKQTVINALQEIHNQAVQSQQDIDKVNDAANKAKKKNEGKPATTPTAPKKSSNFGYGADIDEVFGEGFSDSKIKGFAEKIGKKLAAAMTVINDFMLSPIEEAFTMMMELEVEEAQEALDEVSELYDQAQEKTEESRNRLTEIENQMQNASGARLEQLKAQQADEMAMMAEREAEEKRLEKEKQKREKELEQKQKQQRKLDLKFQLIKAIASNALAIIEALTLGPILGPIFAAIIGAMGALQIAVITKQLSKLADGGLLQGKSHAQGGIPVGNTGIEVEGGEYVVNKRSTAKYLPLLQALNEEGARHKTFANQVGKYANGGELNSQRITSNYDYLNNSKAIERTIEAIDIHPVVEVVQIAKGINQLTEVREIAGGGTIINN